MEEAEDRESGFGFEPFPPPALISLSPFSPSPRRLSSNFIPSNVPVRAEKQPAWLSLQGWLIGAEEATSARAIGGGLSPEEAVAWQLFSPIQRVLVVAIIAVAASISKKNNQILELQKSVELRDLVLSAMQEELDNLCDQVNYFKDQPDTRCNLSSTKSLESSFDESLSQNFKYVGCDCQPCEYHQFSSYDSIGNAFVKSSNCEDAFNYQLPLINDTEREERRMSSLSDWAPSVISSIDFQLQLDSEHDIYNLRKECEEKDATIKELSTHLQSSEVVSSKRISELEDIIRRKKMIIKKLKKDMATVEQKVFHLSRVRRTFASSSSNANARRPPAMADNVLYDMNSTTNSSSSDSDFSSRNKCQSPVVKSQKNQVQNSSCSSIRDHALRHTRSSNVVLKSIGQHQQSQSTTLKENSLNHKPHSDSFSRSRHPLSIDEDLKSRRRPPTKSKDATVQKRWP